MRIIDYTSAAAYLGHRTERTIPSIRATCLRRFDENTIVLVYHFTYVVTYYRDGRVLLDSGGWRTATTKARMNEYSPVSVHSKRGKWIVTTRSGDAIPFIDKIWV